MALLSALGIASLADTKPALSNDDSTLSLAICPIVYPVDQSPSERGYHYIFYGNGFFINKEGYLLTAAHVLSQVSDGQAYILLRLPMAPPRLLQVTLVAMDLDHDVALLRATPNPFDGKYQVRYLPLQVESPATSQAVQAAALRPSRIKDPHTFDAFVEDRPSGGVLGYEFSSPDKGRTDTELFLFSHEVLFGDSGAPVVSTESQAVVGLVKGRWLRPNPASLATPAKQPAGGVAATLPIHYAIALLQQQGVAWSAAPTKAPELRAEASTNESSTPVPLSLIAAPYPSQALLGGEVVLDAMVDRNGQLADIKVVRGAAPFLDKVLSAVKTWSFLPARENGEAVEARVGIAFQFVPPSLSLHSKPQQGSAEKSAVLSVDTLERGAVPMHFEAPQMSAIAGSEASVIFSAQIDAQGHADSVKILRGGESLGASMTSALGQWQFTPAKHIGVNCASTFIAVQIYRGGAQISHAQSNTASHTIVH